MNLIASDKIARAWCAAEKRVSRLMMVIMAAIFLSSFGQSAIAQVKTISSAYLTGTWKEDMQCTGSVAMVFFPNNTMSSAGSVPVNYSVTGPSQFTMHGPGGAAVIMAQYINQNQMLVTFQNDSSVFYRCGATNARAGNHAQLTRAYLVGGWGYNGNCQTPEVFSPGGQFRTSNNAWGNWVLSGNQLRLTPDNGVSIDFSVQANGRQNMTLTQNNNGQISHYTRCH